MAKTEKDLVEVKIPRSEYERLKAKEQRDALRSGRMSLRIPFETWKALKDKSSATNKPKTQIVLEALARDLVPGGVLE